MKICLKQSAVCFFIFFGGECYMFGDFLPLYILSLYVFVLIRDLREHLRRLQQQSDSRRRAAVMEMMRQRAAEVANNGG